MKKEFKRPLDWYDENDKYCHHCGGNIMPGHVDERRVKYWCDNCGSNSKKNKPSIIVN